MGRAKENDILCISIHVSRYHAKIILKNDHPFITDLGVSIAAQLIKILLVLRALELQK